MWKQSCFTRLELTRELNLEEESFLCFNYTKTVRLQCCHIVFPEMTCLDCHFAKSEVIEQGLSTALET